jgi:hypothetical protein
MTGLRDELDIRRRRLLNALDELMAYHLKGRVSWSRRDELVDEIEWLLETSDLELLRSFTTAQGAAPSPFGRTFPARHPSASLRRKP